jgi:hypothetical protein
MTIRKILAASLAATALLGAGGPALAGHYRHYYQEQPVGYHTHDGRMLYQGRDIGGYVDRYNWPDPSGGCIRMCNSDNLPCDPVYFKVADGRCTSNAH